MFLLMNVRSLLQRVTAFTGIGLGILGSEAKAQQPHVTIQCKGSVCAPAVGVPFNNGTYVYYGGPSSTSQVQISNSFNTYNSGVMNSGSGNAYQNSPHVENSPGAWVSNRPTTQSQIVVDHPRVTLKQYKGPPRHGHPPIHGRPPIRLSPIENPGLGHYHPTQEPVYEQQPQSRATFPREVVISERVISSEVIPTSQPVGRVVRNSQPTERVVSQPTQSSSGVVISRRDLTPGELAQFRQYGTVIKFEK